MLNKSDVKSCLNGDKIEKIPAIYFWMDSKFTKKNKDVVIKMQECYCDDYIQTFPIFTKNAKEPSDLAPNEFTDVWGCRFIGSPDGVGSHPSSPIINNLDDWEEYKQKYIPSIEPKVFCANVIKARTENPDKYITFNIWRTFYERLYMLSTMEQVWMDMALGEELFKRMLYDLRDFTIEIIACAKGSGADAVFIADDWGTQHRLQISPNAFNNFFKPCYADIIDTIHSQNMDAWMHSCGNITEIIPELIDIKLDVIGHLQTAALDLPAIAQQYQGKITFLGGIDVQFNICTGTRQTIRDEVKSLIDSFDAFNGKYIITPSNSIMPDTPVDNVWHLFEAIKEFSQKN